MLENSTFLLLRLHAIIFSFKTKPTVHLSVVFHSGFVGFVRGKNEKTGGLEQESVHTIS